jgi:hypothetical protein
MVGFLFMLLAQTAAQLVDIDLFTGGEGGYSCYRLPNLLQLRKPGHLVAIAQVRDVAIIMPTKQVSGGYRDTKTAAPIQAGWTHC